MTRRGISSRSRAIAIALCVLSVLGLTFTSADAAELGCAFNAPATVGTADIIDIPPPPEGAPPEAGLLPNVIRLASAGCSQAFDCFVTCQVNLQFGFNGTGLIAGEVRIIDFDDDTGLPFDRARATCGPSVGTPLSGGCFGQLSTTIPASTSLFLECRAYGVVAVLVGGGCFGTVV